MANENLKTLASHGLSAMRAGGDAAARVADEIQNDASHPDLKAALKTSSEVSQQWSARLERARQQVSEGGPNDDPVMEAMFEVSRRIRQAAPDAVSRDLGIIANSQLAIHYWIAAFGTMANYTRQLGMEDVARDMKTSAEEAKAGDEKMTQLAEQILQQG